MTKLCCICKNEFYPMTRTHKVCSRDCAIKFVEEKKAKEERKQYRAVKKEFNQKDKSYLKLKVQALANKYARVRDDILERGCITCPTKYAKWDGGHFLPTSTHPAIRYNTSQIHKQCFRCNRIFSGKPKEYRQAMIELYGIEKVEWLEKQRGVHRKYTVEYYQKYLKVIGKRLKRMEAKHGRS